MVSVKESVMEIVEDVLDVTKLKGDSYIPISLLCNKTII
ncbi:hypothetical protein QOZ93_000392 [Hathewaya limosa]|uniref:Uncharacterized protein n=1 Tax=Hathewaya limosa TaxID=1536 RepID=A0ABU0JNM8_HATLI|nr:hypothetical protein [Hathewaya limosa]